MKKAIIVHSGGMDSTLCLYLASQAYGKENVLSISFDYQQRHGRAELQAAQTICRDWGIDHVVIPIVSLKEISPNALVCHDLEIIHEKGGYANTLVTGRNGLMAMLAGTHANHLGAHCIYMGVIAVDGAKNGYRDCSREYMDLMEQILRLDFNDPTFQIITPLVDMTKAEVVTLAYELGILGYVLENTISCYQGIKGKGCQTCPSCLLRNNGIDTFYTKINQIPTFS